MQSANTKSKCKSECKCEYKMQMQNAGGLPHSTLFRVSMTTVRDWGEERRGNGKDEMRGSLHYATDGETVRYFGRDDASRGMGKESGRAAHDAHLSDDEAVAKMGHPNLDVGHHPDQMNTFKRGFSACMDARGYSVK